MRSDKGIIVHKMSTHPTEKRGVVYVTLKEHLAHLEAIETSKPSDQRRKVPSMAVLARLAGIEPNTMSRWSRNEIGASNHKTLNVIISELRARGFPADISDILAYRET